MWDRCFVVSGWFEQFGGFVCLWDGSFINGSPNKISDFSLTFFDGLSWHLCGAVLGRLLYEFGKQLLFCFFCCPVRLFQHMIVDSVFGAQGQFSGWITGKSTNGLVFGRFVGRKTGGAFISGRVYGGFAGRNTGEFAGRNTGGFCGGLAARKTGGFIPRLPPPLSPIHHITPSLPVHLTNSHLCSLSSALPPVLPRTPTSPRSHPA